MVKIVFGPGHEALNNAKQPAFRLGMRDCTGAALARFRKRTSGGFCLYHDHDAAETAFPSSLS